MEKARFTETQIVNILKLTDSGIKVEDICRQNGISRAIYYNWKSKYGGMEDNDVQRLTELEEENTRLKKLFAEVSLENHAMKKLFAKKKVGNNREKVLCRIINGFRPVGYYSVQTDFFITGLFLSARY